MDKKNTRIIIIGGNSSVSRYLQPLFCKDYEIVTVGRRDCDINLVPNKSLSDQLPEQADIVIHTAAAFGRQTDEEIYETEKYNVLDTMELCFHLKNMNVKHFVFISSIFVHLEETSPLYSIYNISKQHAEEVIKYCLERDEIPYTILRPSQLFGKDKSFEYHHPFLYELIDMASKGNRISLFGNYGGSAHYLHITDFAEVINRVVNNSVFGVYDCITKKPNTYLEIAQTTYELTNNPVNIDFIKDRKESGQSFKYSDALYKLINYYPKVSLKDAIHEILEHQGFY